MKPHDLTVLLADMMEATNFRASDINFTPGARPQMEVDGTLIPHAFEPMTPEQTKEIVDLVIGEDEALRRELNETGSFDCAYTLPGDIRFRCNAFSASGTYSLVMRVMPRDMPTIDGLGLPPVLKQIPELRNGLVIVTGATGSGKTTTLTAIIDQINRDRAAHIVTLEDPIEFRHPHLKATVNQREMGQDFRAFSDGLRAALRQAPKVILVGEIRDRDTLEIAMKAAETGQLVLTTLHTIDAGQTIERILGMFESNEERLVRGRLAQVLRFVICQRLVPRKQGRRVAAVEIMGMNLRVRDMILNGETSDRTFRQVIGESTSQGWQTFDMHLAKLFAEDVIDAEAAATWASDRAIVTKLIDGFKSSRGESTSDLGDLQMDFVRRIKR